MKLLVDTHCHTLASGHAYSTIEEMVKQARKKGLEMIAITDHGMAMPGTCHEYYFSSLRFVPHQIDGVKILRGVEANVINMSGELDMPERILKNLDLVIASFHTPCVKPGTCNENTNAWINVIQNPYVDILGHSGNPKYECNYDEVLKAAKEYDKLVEINNHSFEVRAGSKENCKNIALKCKELGVKVVVGSDAHISFSIGEFKEVCKIFEEIKMPEELIMNTSAQKLIEYLNRKKR